MKTIEIAFSSCPNDTFMFAALVNGWINTHEYRFIPIIGDIHELNTWASRRKYPVTKISFYALGYLQHSYSYLRAGAALGHGCGPILITRPDVHTSPLSTQSRILIPGTQTTAHFLLQLYFPHLSNTHCVLFSQIENLLLQKKAEAGVIIHESRFTYEQKGLIKIADMGELWEKHTHLPIPLGAIATSHQLPENDKRNIEELIRQSIIYAYQHKKKIWPYVKSYAQSLDNNVIEQHICLYVNDYSLDIGETGEKAIHTFLNIGKEKGMW